MQYVCCACNLVSAPVQAAATAAAAVMKPVTRPAYDRQVRSVALGSLGKSDCHKQRKLKLYFHICFSVWVPVL